MTDYRVIWEIDVEADSPAEAAIKAARFQHNEDTTATVFTVNEQISDCGGSDDGPIFQRVAEFDVRPAPSHPFYRALSIEEGEREDAVDAIEEGE